jgi:hypothetical protein
MGDLRLLDKWYKALIAAGVALGVGAVAAHHNQLLVMAVGMVLVGVGEFMNHPFRSYRDGLTVYEGHPRIPCLAGHILDAVGALIMLFGIVKLLMLA